MKRKIILTAVLLYVMLYVPFSLFGQSRDFEMRGTVLVRYNGSAANVTIPAGITAIDDSAFRNHIRLTSITIPSSVTSIGDRAFSTNSLLTSITVDNQNSAYSSVEGVLFNKNRTILVKYPESKQETSYTIPSSVTSIGNDAFLSCSNLTSITIPSSVTFIGNYAFSFCRNLTSITIPSSVTSIGNRAFENTSITSITIPSSVTSIGDDVFSSCDRLTTIIVDNQNSTYLSVDGVLFNKNRTILMRYPQGKQGSSYTIPSSVTSIGNYAFYRCKLTSITIPSSVTSIGERAFFQCNNLTSITIPSSVTSIGNEAFGLCSSLTSVTISRRTTIGRNAFPSTARITYSD
jgi:hypothetical protein